MKKAISMLFVLFLIIIPSVAFSQGCTDCGPGDTPEDVPIDDGLILFIITGIVYGITICYRANVKRLNYKQR